MAEARPPASTQSYIDRVYIDPSGVFDAFNPERRIAYKPDSHGRSLDPAHHGPFYVFVTAPDLRLDYEETKNSLGIGTPSAPSNLAKMLMAGSAGSRGNGFIHLLTNSALSAPQNDLVMDTHEVAENFIGGKQTVAKSTLNSRQSGTIQIQFQEWMGAPISLLTRIWVEYTDGVVAGKFKPKDDYLAKKIIDYACSIFVFQLSPDGYTIEWATKYTGCFPLSVPSTSFEGRMGAAENVTVTVPFAYTYMDTMDPSIFADFNFALNSPAEDEPDLRTAIKRAAAGLLTTSGLDARATQSRVEPMHGVRVFLNQSRGHWELHFTATNPVDRI